MNNLIFFKKKLWKNNTPYIVAYTLMFFLNVVLIDIIATYINTDCCGKDIGIIIFVLVITSLFITSIISRMICITCDKSDTKGILAMNVYNLDNNLDHGEGNEYVEV